MAKMQIIIIILIIIIIFRWAAMKYRSALAPLKSQMDMILLEI